LKKSSELEAAGRRYRSGGRIVRELNDPTIRELLVFKYRLLDEVEDHRVLIVALLHGARDFATWRRTQQQE
jgi:hypothetical protein